MVAVVVIAVVSQYVPTVVVDRRTIFGYRSDVVDAVVGIHHGM